jgi:transcriptional regulator with XRE-family HTH domain
MPQEKSLAHFGERLAHLRKVRGLTQEQLGEPIGRTAQSISDYENGIRMAPTEVLLGIGEVLATPFVSLVGPDPGLAEEGPTYDAGSSRSDRIAVIFDQIRIALDLAERMLREGESLNRG